MSHWKREGSSLINTFNGYEVPEYMRRNGWALEHLRKKQWFGPQCEEELQLILEREARNR